MRRLYNYCMDQSTRPLPRAEALDLVAKSLLARSSLLTRLLMRSGSRELTRTELGLLSTLAQQPRRITQLAESEALTQPAISKLVDKLADRDLVERGRATDDGRVVLVSISSEGLSLLASVRTQTRALLREVAAELSDDDLGALVTAGEVLERLIRALQREGGRA
jgi:DNA-binding MarR family transcriptional regulator